MATINTAYFLLYSINKQVTGSYSYSDGFVLRTVEYKADQNGYRVVK